MAEQTMGQIVLSLLERRLKDAQESFREGKKNNAPNLKALQTALDDAEKALSKFRESRGADRKRLTNKYIDEYYDEVGEWVRSLVKQFPSLMKFFSRAISNGWSNEEFLNELYKSDWWKEQGEAGRGSRWLEIFMMENDRAQQGRWIDLVRQTSQKIRDLADQLYDMKLDDVNLDNLTRRYLRQGWDWNDERGLRSWLAREFERQQTPPDPGDGEDDGVVDDEVSGVPQSGGAFVDYERKFRDAVRSFGLQRTEEWFRTTAAALLNPDSGVTEDDVWNELIREAETLYPAFAGRLGKERTVRDLASGYLGWASRILELDADSLELDDPAIAAALGFSDDKGNPTLMPMWEFRKNLRLDDRWQFTDNARDTYMSAGTKFAQALGLAG